MPKAEEVVVVTGASSGIGRAIVRRFARPGVAIGLVARGRDGLAAAAAEVEAAGGTALVLALGDPGAHGPFDERAHARSVQLWATKHRAALLAAPALGALVAGALRASRH